ncbi:hypothetical protein C5167_038281 [Papaver somniferum]|uniref:Uncharacterized protein n=1 Tax=Papaver somniferum TaxID=3469 RepID=A0A4Y7IC24_PAPSO|nr:hypothetical protein C5167_038281 [Papaver somniferum]
MEHAGSFHRIIFDHHVNLGDVLHDFDIRIGSQENQSQIFGNKTKLQTSFSPTNVLEISSGMAANVISFLTESSGIYTQVMAGVDRDTVMVYLIPIDVRTHQCFNKIYQGSHTEL